MSTLEPYRFDQEAFYKKWGKFDLANNPSVKSFYLKKYIIINLHDFMFNPSNISTGHVSRETLQQLKNGDWPYETIFESQKIIIFKLKKDD